MTPRNFIIIGAQRCGTTSLYEYICAHPDVKRYKYESREIHFFDLEYHKGFEWYRLHFPRTRGTGFIAGESSPNYIFDPVVPGRIAEHAPHVRLIAILRNPARRAYSQYYHNQSRGTEPLTFRRALDAEDVRRDSASKREWIEWSYKARGRYAEQLQRWFKHFPRKRILILKSEDLFDNPQCEMAKVFEFLKLKPFEQSEYGVYQKQRYRLYTGTYDYLMDYFEPYNKELYKLLGRDLGWDE